MKLSHLFIAFAALPLVACASNAKETAPAEGGEAAASAAPKESRNAFERMFGMEGDTPNAGPCPLMGVLYDASRVVEFNGEGERFANVAYTGELRGVRGLCRYTDSNPIELSLEVDMAFGKGPAASSNQRTYRYWVAVTRTNLAPIEKQYFDVPVQFPRGEDRVAGSKAVATITIPRANDTISGANFEVLVGFDLSPEQLAFNRAGKRFRVDVGSRQ